MKNNTTESKTIENIVIKGLEVPTFDLTVDYSEIALDSFIDNDAIREIPIVKSIVGIVKGGIKIREMYFAKKLLTFLNEYHNGKLSDLKKQEFIIKFNSDSKYRESVVEQIMILNERFLEVQKAKFLANLFMSHVNGKFDWETFSSLSNCLDRLNLIAIDFLDEMANLKNPFYKGYSQFDDNVAFLISAGIAQQWGTHLQITAHGQYLYFYGIKGDIDYEFPKPSQKNETDNSKK